MDWREVWKDQNFRGSFRRWWWQDWSWDGLASKPNRAALGLDPVGAAGTLQDVWRQEEGRLIDFAGRRWTRFHLPPLFYPELRASRERLVRDRFPPFLCQSDVWDQAKGASTIDELRQRLDAAMRPDDDLRQRWSLEDVASFADLRGVVFPEAFAYSGTELLANLGSAIFCGDFSYYGKVLSRFRFATFAGRVAFRGAEFPVEALFTDATFCADAIFDSANFLGDVQFGGTAFSARASFHGAAPFRRTTSFSRTRFCDAVDFTNCVFQDSTDFSGASFDGVAKFNQVILHSDTDFSGMSFRAGEAPSRDWWPYTIIEARLEDPMRFSGHDRFDILFYRTQIIFWRALYILRWIPPLLVMRWTPMRKIRADRDRATVRYENSFRHLRRLSSEIGDIQAEGMFHALELRCHRARTNARSLDRLVSLLYGILSDYGQSMARPLAVILVFWAVAIAFYSYLLRNAACKARMSQVNRRSLLEPARNSSRHCSKPQIGETQMVG